jgi:hypothetical protein|tara:strand:- start:29395 stop:29931 length:537 start_codon:yes stop_codon:yes gene_type:complete
MICQDTPAQETNMRHLKTFSSCLAALVLHSAAWAEIYETTDAQGNPEFTDSPPGPDAEEVDLQQTNIIDAPPDEPQQVSAPQSVNEQPVSEEDNRTVIHDSDDDEYDVSDAYSRREQAFDRMNPEAPREVGDSSSQMPREVGDFDTQAPDEVRDDDVHMSHEVDAPVIERRVVHPHKR